MRLLLTIDAIRRVDSDVKINLTIPYFPYARQDRVCNEGEALSVKVMADLINSTHCNKVTIFDPHSDVTPALLNNCHSISLADIISNSELAQFIVQNNLVIVSPDAGAEKKVRSVAKLLSSKDYKQEILYASKVRDTQTGNITSTEIHADVRNKDLIILDDICDGGKTFIELSQLLQSKGSGKVYLYVTHGIFSKGLDVLKEYFTQVYCYHTMLKEEEIDTKFLKVLGGEK